MSNMFMLQNGCVTPNKNIDMYCKVITTLKILGKLCHAVYYF